MGKTIIQTIGPLYGEVVNGTVFGRPNGSVYVPVVNTISINLEDRFKFVRKFTFAYGDRYIVCTSTGSGGAIQTIAESQDTASYISTHLEDANGNVIGTERANAAGLFNISTNTVGSVAESDPAIVADEIYFIVAVLYSASGVPVATTKQEVKGVVVA